MKMKTLDLEEAAHFLRLHPHTLEAKARAGEIPGAKPGKRWVFIDEDLANWLRRQYPEPAQVNRPEANSVQRTNRSPEIAARKLERLLSERRQKPVRRASRLAE